MLELFLVVGTVSLCEGIVPQARSTLLKRGYRILRDKVSVLSTSTSSLLVLLAIFIIDAVVRRFFCSSICLARNSAKEHKGNIDDLNQKFVHRAYFSYLH